MSRDGRLGPLYSHTDYRYDEPRISAALVETQRRTINGVTLSRAAYSEIKKETAR